MALVGYEPHPDGGYVFRNDAGGTLRAFGPEAESMRAYLDQTRPQDSRLAFNAAAPFGSVESVPDAPPAPPPERADVGPLMSAAPAPEPAASMPPPGPPPPRGMPPQIRARPDIGAASPPSSQPAAPESQESAPGPIQEAAPSDGPTIPGQVIADYALRPRYSGGRAAYDPEADAASRRPVPVARQDSAVPRTPEEEAAWRAQERAIGAVNDSAQADLEAAGAERIAAAEQRKTDALNATLQADIERRDAQAKLAHSENVWNATNAGLQREADAATQMKVDPNRLFKEKGTFGTIVSALAVAMGAFGAALSKTPNYALQITQAAIDRDIAAQEDEIRRKGANAQNALANFQKTYGLTLEEARIAVRSTAQNYIAARAESQAAAIGSPEAKQQAALIRAQQVQANAKAQAELETLVRGRASTSYQMLAPQRAVAPGRRDPTAAEVKADAEALGAVNKAAGGDPEQRRAAADELRAKSEERQAQSEADRRVEEYGKRKQEVDQANTVLQSYVEGMGGAIQPDGTIKWADRDAPGTGRFDSNTLDIIDTNADRRVKQDRAWLEANVGKQLSGSSVSPQQERQIKKLLSEGDEVGARRGAEQLLRDARDKLREVDASFGPEVVSTYERNKSQVARSKQAAAHGRTEEPF